MLKKTLSQGLKLIGLGLACDLIIAFVLTRVMASMLFGISATDPITFLSISFVLLAVAPCSLATSLPYARHMSTP